MTRGPAEAAVTQQPITVPRLKRKVDITPEFILCCNLSTNYFSSQHRHPDNSPLDNLSPYFTNTIMVFLWLSWNSISFFVISTVPSICLQITLSAPEQGLNFKASSQASWTKRDQPRTGAEKTLKEKSSSTSFDGRGVRQISIGSL